MNSRNLIFMAVFLFTFVTTNVCPGQTSVESLLPKDHLGEWTLVSGPQVYTRKTLFEHIDGQAELFFKYGFQKSAFAIYQGKKSRENQIELDVYDMGNVLHAFGVFSRSRNEDHPAGIGLDSWFDDHSLLFYKGKYFVMLYATEAGPPVLKELGTTMSSRISDRSPGPKEIGYFPKDGLNPGSIQYFPEGLLGYQFLKRGFQGTYVEKIEVKVKDEDKVEKKEGRKVRAEGKEFNLFLAIFKNSKDAEDALKIYRDSLSKAGKVQSENPGQFGSKALKGEDPYRGNVIVFQKGFYLAGMIGFENVKSAEKLLEAFVQNIQ
jgi:hypothetical protein